MKKVFLLLCCSFVFLSAAGCGKKKPDYNWYKNDGFVTAINNSDAQKAIGLLHTTKIDINSLNKEGQTALLYALENTEDENIIEDIASYSADVDAKNEAGRTALYIAARSIKNQKVLLALLRCGADVSKDPQGLLDAADKNQNPQVKQILTDAINKMPWYKNTAFVDALKAGSVEGIRKELPFTDINAQDEKGVNAAFAALSNPQLQIIKLLLKNTKDVNAKYKGITPVLLFAAPTVTDPVIFKAYIDAGAMVNDTDEQGNTPLIIIAGYNKNPLPLIKLFLDSGADINIQNKQGNTALMYAVRNRTDLNIISFLLKQKADINLTNKNGETALHIAARYNANERIASALTEEKAVQLEAKDIQGNTPLISAAYNENNLVSNVLLQAGADIKAKNSANQNGLEIAAQYNKNPKTALTFLSLMPSVENPKNILALAAKNTNAEVKNSLEEMMPYKASSAASAASSQNAAPWYSSDDFQSAVIKSDIKLLKKSLSGGLNLNAMQPGSVEISALMFAAARSKNAEVIYTLVKAGGDVNARNKNGDSALSVAALVNKNAAIIEALISAGADVNAKDNSGVSVLAVAASNNPSEAVMQTLLKNGARGTKAVMLQYAEKNQNKAIKDILENGL